MVNCRKVRHHTIVQPLSPSEQRIVDLCAKAIASQDSEDFQPAIDELRAALREQLEATRDKVADLALLVAARNESQAAD
jgi:hypothetical protein